MFHSTALSRQMFVGFLAQMEYQEQQRALPFSIENILREDFPPPSRLSKLPTEFLARAPREKFHNQTHPSLSQYGCCSVCYQCLANPRVCLNSLPAHNIRHQEHGTAYESYEVQPPCGFMKVPYKLGVQRKQLRETARAICSEVFPVGHATKANDTTGTKTEEKPEVTTAVITKKKRFRSHFSQRQLQYLEGVFSRQQYLSREERALLANALDMTELQIRNWFQNRRYQKRHRQMLAQRRIKQVAVRVLVREKI